MSWREDTARAARLARRTAGKLEFASRMARELADAWLKVSYAEDVEAMRRALDRAVKAQADALAAAREAWQLSHISTFQASETATKSCGEVT